MRRGGPGSPPAIRARSASVLGRRTPLCVTLEEFNAQAPTSHLQPRPSPSTHLARPQRNGSQLSILLRRNRARSRLDTTSTALTRHTAMRELRTHRAIHSRRRLSSSARRSRTEVCRQARGRRVFPTYPRSSVFTSGPIHEVLGPYRRGIPKTGCLNCGRPTITLGRRSEPARFQSLERDLASQFHPTKGER